MLPKYYMTGLYTWSNRRWEGGTNTLFESLVSVLTNAFNQIYRVLRIHVIFFLTCTTASLNTYVLTILSKIINPLKRSEIYLKMFKKMSKNPEYIWILFKSFELCFFYTNTHYIGQCTSLSHFAHILSSSSIIIYKP